MSYIEEIGGNHVYKAAIKSVTPIAGSPDGWSFSFQTLGDRSFIVRTGDNPEKYGPHSDEALAWLRNEHRQAVNAMGVHVEVQTVQHEPGIGEIKIARLLKVSAIELLAPVHVSEERASFLIHMRSGKPLIVVSSLVDSVTLESKRTAIHGKMLEVAFAS